jgi:hypothetical protein
LLLQLIISVERVLPERNDLCRRELFARPRSRKYGPTLRGLSYEL